VHCRDHAVQLYRAREQFEQAGLRLVLIGQASPRQARHFRDKLDLDPLPVLADDERESYRAAGLRRANLTQLVGPRSVLSGLKHGARSGVVQGRIIGDAAQLGGEMIVLEDGTVAWSHAQENAGDTMAPDDLLEAAREAS
jgi:prostamide/prostaglandin F2alpha synthase